MTSQSNNLEDSADFGKPTPTSFLVELRNQETAAWERFSQLYGGLVFHWLAQLGITSKEERQDYLHDICIHLMEHIHQYRKEQDVGGFRAWMKVVIKNIVLGRQRKHEQEGQLALVYAPDSSKIIDPHSSVLESVIKREQEKNHVLHPEDVENMDEDTTYYRGLKRLLSHRFSQRDIDIFYQLSCEKKKTVQVAELFGLTTANVKKIRQRVRDYLKEYMGDMDDIIVTDDDDEGC